MVHVGVGTVRRSTTTVGNTTIWSPVRGRANPVSRRPQNGGSALLEEAMSAYFASLTDPAGFGVDRVPVEAVSYVHLGAVMERLENLGFRYEEEEPPVVQPGELPYRTCEEPGPDRHDNGARADGEK